MSRMLGDIGDMQNSFFIILELVVKEPLYNIIFNSHDVLLKLGANTFCICFHSISGLIISRIGKRL